MASSETKLTIVISIAIICFTLICVKGCSIATNKDVELKKHAMDKGYIQKEQMGQTGLKWVKPE